MSQIRQKNEQFLDRVPLEEFTEELVRGLRHMFHEELQKFRNELQEFRSELQKFGNELQFLRAEEQKTMATVADTETAIARYQAAVEARETNEEAKIADLEQHVIPDSIVQGINDAAAKIEAQNAPPAVVVSGDGTQTPGDGSGGGDGTEGATQAV